MTTTTVPRTISSQLSVFDRYLTLWILLAMASGLMLGYLVPDIGPAFEAMSIGSTSLPIAAGLILMLYPSFAKVRYDNFFKVFRNWRVLILSFVQNWVVGPLLMFGLAAAFLMDKPEYMVGLVLIGVARCIGMVLVWNELAKGDTDYCPGLVAFNSIFQIVFYSALATFFASVLPNWLGLPASEVNVNMWEIAKSVGIYLGVPFLAGFLSWLVLRAAKGESWYFDKLVPAVGPITFYSLLYIIVVMFSIQGKAIIGAPMDVLLIAAPLTLYFVIMFVISFAMSAKAGATYEQGATLSFTASSNNFDLAIAVAIATFGVGSSVAFATVIGPLVEVPVMIGLVHLSMWIRSRYFGGGTTRVPAR